MPSKHTITASKTPEAAIPRWLPWVAVAAITLVTCAVYVPALRAPLIMDDIGSIAQNVTIRRLWPPWVPLSPPPRHLTVSGRPVVNYTLAIDYALNHWLNVDSRPDPLGPNKTLAYHLTNLLLHLGCGVLLFGVLRRTLRIQRYSEDWAAHAGGAATLVTALWLIHPIQSEAVIYVIQRTELLVSACYLGTLYGSIRAWDAKTERARLKWYAAAGCACLLGMGSKEVMISAPLVVVLYDRAFHFRSWRDVLHPPDGRGWFYLLLIATTGWLFELVIGGARTQTAAADVGNSWYLYLYTQAWAVLHYLRLVFWPSGLDLDYGEAPIRGLAGVPGVLILSVLGLATILAWTRAQRWGWFGFLGAWFFLILAPSSSVVPIWTEIAAERRFYLPLVAVLVLIVVGADELLRRVATGATANRHRGIRWWGYGVIYIALASATFERSSLYASTEALWRDVIARSPGNARGYDNLASALLAKRPPRDSEAEALLHRAVALDSMLPVAWYRLALIAVHQGRLDAARTRLEYALRADSTQPRWRSMLGSVLVSLGKPALGIPYLEEANAILPTTASLVDLADAYMAVGRLRDAANTLNAVLQADPMEGDALSLMGAVKIAQDQADQALPFLERALALNPAGGLALARLSLAFAKSGHLGQVAPTATQATLNAGGDPRVYALSGEAMLRANRVAEGEAYLQQAVQIDSANAEALTALGEALAGQGKRANAAELFQRALRAQPGFSPAAAGLARLGGGRGG